MIFCTLFDSRYLDKGLVLYESLLANVKNFKLYVVAFDEICYQTLYQYVGEQLIVISMKEFETPELLAAKKNRTEREYCWTCSCYTIKHVLEHYHEDCCTYIDADMYFYQSPQILFEEIQKDNCDVSIIRHGFTEVWENRRIIRLAGKYCVEFNTFYATKNGMKVLNWWCQRCFECCTEKMDGKHFGDQKYLDQLQEMFPGVHVLQHQGAGVAPWNLARFSYVSHNEKNGEIILKEKRTKKLWPLIFYHFQNIDYLSEKEIDIGMYLLYPRNISKQLRDIIYLPYLKRICEKRAEIKKDYGIDMDKKQVFVERVTFGKYLFSQLRSERNPFMFLSHIYRMLFRKSRDYIMLDGIIPRVIE